MHAQQIVALTATALLALLAGCIHAIKQGYREARGADAEIEWITPMPAGSFDRFRSVELEPCSTSAPRICPMPLLDAYNNALTAISSELDRTYPGGEPRLRIASEMVYFKRKGPMSSGMCLTRVRMLDGGTTIGDAMLVGESDAFRAGDEEALARANAETLGELLAARKREPKAEPAATSSP